MKHTLFITLNSKGGVGKSLTTLNLCQLAALRGFDFEYLELDNSNDTPESLKKSEIFKNKMSSYLLSQAQEELVKATYKALKQNKLVFVDIGGGTDTAEIIKLVNEEFSHHNIAYILPFQNSNKQMKNLEKTYLEICSPDNIYLVKNQVKSQNDPFRFFEGDKTLDIESHRKILNPVNKVFKILDSDIQQIPENTNESMLDCAQLAVSYSRQEAEKLFMEQAKDMEEYNKLMAKYNVAFYCLKEIERLNEEFEELFNDN